jgi:hypothetical protein
MFVGYVIDPRKNWQTAERHLAEEHEPRRRQILECLIEHSKAESCGDFGRLMDTVSPRAHYKTYAVSDEAERDAQSPKGKDGVAAYYKGIVEAGCHRIEHDVERMVVGRDALTTEGRLRMAYPGNVLALMGTEVPDPSGLYLYEQRLLIVWEFDEEGLVLCEDSYSGGGVGFEGIAERRLNADQIYEVSATDVA